MVKELNRENLNVIQLFEWWNIYVLTLSDVQKNSINEKKERFNVEVLSPAQAQIKEKFWKSLVPYPSVRLFFELGCCSTFNPSISFSNFLALRIWV